MAIQWQGRHWVSVFEIDRWGLICFASKPVVTTKRGSLAKASTHDWRYWFASPLSLSGGLRKLALVEMLSQAGMLACPFLVVVQSLLGEGID